MKQFFNEGMVVRFVFGMHYFWHIKPPARNPQIPNSSERNVNSMRFGIPFSFVFPNEIEFQFLLIECILEL